MAVSSSPELSVDGRLARGNRTRRAVAAALLELIAEGDLQPTARRLAERAGVSLRLVFHHFDDMESVLQSAVTIQVDRHWSRLVLVPATLPRTERIRAIVGQRAEVFAAVAPVRRATRLVEHSSPTVRTELEQGRQRLRDALEHTFSPELDAVDPGARQGVADVLETACSWETWEQLDRVTGGDAVRTVAGLEALMTAVLASSDQGGRP